MLDGMLQRLISAEAPTVKEAVTKAWRENVSAACHEDTSDWDPYQVRVTLPTDEHMARCKKLPDHTDTPLVVVDIEGPCPMGFVVPIG